MKLALAIVLLVVGSVLFHLYSPWWFTPIASNWDSIDTTVDITLWVTGSVFVAVNLFLAYVIFRYRYKKNRKSEYNPENRKLEIGLTWLTSLGIAAMLAPGLIVWADLIKPPADSLVVEAVGQQWQWSFRFSGADGQFGKTHASFLSPDNPFGLDPADPHGQDDILINSNELHLPLGQAIKLRLRSKDVLHNFAVPQFRVKMDLVPGSVSSLWFTPTRNGRFDILCQELCGVAHFAMRGYVVIEDQADYERWLSSFPTFAQLNTPHEVDLAKGETLYAVCSACHGLQGEGNALTNAPKLSGLSFEYLKRQLLNYKHGIRGAAEADTFGRQMATMMATLPTVEDITHVSAYIASLKDQDSPNTIDGQLDKGRVYYNSCGVCHGAHGEGSEFNGAPKLAGQHDWYLKRQIEQFNLGIRGAHANDQFGRQMRLMAAALKTDESINDLLAYVNALPVDTTHNKVTLQSGEHGGAGQ